MTTTTAAKTSVSARVAGRGRLLGLVGAVVAALVVYALARLIVGQLHQPAFGTGSSQQLTREMVAGIVLVAGLVAWAASSALRRLTAGAHRVWMIGTPALLVVSLGAPFAGHGVSAANRLSLAAMHLAVGAVLIPLLRPEARTASPGKGRGR